MYAKIKSNDLPRRQRRSESKFESTPEWKMMEADLYKGLKPREALKVTLSDEDKKRCGITARRTIVRFMQKYLAARDLDYRVQSGRRDGQDFIVISHK